MKWHELSWPEIEAQDKETVLVIPLGSCEQHGRHLPLFVDSLQLQALVDRLEARLPREMVALPVLWLGASHHHLDFPGALRGAGFQTERAAGAGGGRSGSPCRRSWARAC